MVITSSVAQKWQEKGYTKIAEHLEKHVEEWLTGKRYPDMEELGEPRRYDERERYKDKVMLMER